MARGTDRALEEFDREVRLAKMVVSQAVSTGSGGTLPDQARHNIFSAAAGLISAGRGAEVDAVLARHRMPEGSPSDAVWLAIVDSIVHALAPPAGPVGPGPAQPSPMQADGVSITIRPLPSSDGNAYGRTTLDGDDAALNRIGQSLYLRGDAGDLAAAASFVWLDAAGRRGSPPIAGTSAPHPFWMPPGPLDLKLPLHASGCQVPCLAPWWNELVIPSEAPGSSRALLRGEMVRYYRRPLGSNGEWEGGARLSDRDEAPMLEIRDGHVRVVSTVVVGNQSQGALPAHAQIGCRIHWDFLTAVELRMEFSTFRPLLGVGKKLVDSRGYQPCSDYYIALELNDGFQEHRVRFDGGALRVEAETEPVNFVRDLVVAVSSDRATKPWTADSSRAALQHMASMGPTVSEERRGTGQDACLYRTWRQALPASRPISVAEPGW